jgi:hypothetical protein
MDHYLPHAPGRASRVIADACDHVLRAGYHRSGLESQPAMLLRRNRRVMTTVCVVAVSSHGVTGWSAEGRVMTSEALWSLSDSVLATLHISLVGYSTIICPFYHTFRLDSFTTKIHPVLFLALRLLLSHFADWNKAAREEE